MVSMLILCFFSGLVLYFASMVVGIGGERNTIGRAFMAAVALHVVGYVVALADIWVISLLWPILWLYVFKTIYDIGWLRAFGVGCVTIVLAVLLVMFVLVPLGLSAAALAAVLA